jgi:hypothetical protein
MEIDITKRENKGIKDRDLNSRKVKVAVKVKRKMKSRKMHPIMLNLTWDFNLRKSWE